MVTEAEPKICPNCGDEFIPSHHNQKHCSAACRQAFYRKKKKGENIESPPERNIESVRQRARELRRQRLENGQGNVVDSITEDRRLGFDAGNEGQAFGIGHSSFPGSDGGIEEFLRSDASGDRGARSDYRKSGDYRDLFGENREDARGHDQRISGADESLDTPRGIFLLPEPKGSEQPKSKAEKKKESQFRKKLNELARVTSKSPLSGKETDMYRDVVKTVFEAVFEQIDWVVTHTNRAHETCEIWTLDDEDAYKLADGWLALGKRSGTIAYTTRMINNAQSMGYVMLIPAGKVIETMIFYARNGGIGY